MPSGSDSLPRLVQFLADVSSAWESATAEQQNKLARALFEEIWIKDKEVVFVKPRPELVRLAFLSPTKTKDLKFRSHSNPADGGFSPGGSGGSIRKAGPGTAAS